MPLCIHGKAIYPDVKHLLMSPETGLVLKLGIAAGDCIAVSDLDSVILLCAYLSFLYLPCSGESMVLGDRNVTYCNTLDSLVESIFIYLRAIQLK